VGQGFRASSEPVTVSASTSPNAAIPTGRPIVTTLQVGQDVTVDQLKLNLDISTPYRGDLVVTLESPEGTRHVVHSKSGGSSDDLRGSFDLSKIFAGEFSAGEWKLSVEDTFRDGQGSVNAWGLDIVAKGRTEPGPVDPGPVDPGPVDPGPVDPTDPQIPSTRDPRFEGLSDRELKTKIGDVSKKKNNLSYDAARKAMFSDIDNVNGTVTCVYTGRELQTNKVPSASNMNTEHTWPQSKGATGAAKSDLHHLFVTDSKANSSRSSFPFGEVVDGVKWSHPSGAKLGRDASGQMVFEPPDEHKGNVARALFYFSAVYNKPIGANEEAAAKAWNTLDPVDAAEIARNDAIEKYQKNRNPFIDDPTLANDIRDF